ncbi:GNAT family N-acetyltransferase [Paraburkholderia sp. Ac-20340]|uniref:GNAT family N-acetyltransferase n=1 Tax=Paraburkholderia sp. Ac-20340 TaxID=2703888 RepID=UPI001980A170|nr:GNAT family N-acetyltransferase [Paraburkholderia sp. Ac-20340]MBN3854226.1 GNAT family N-acetyltransferase [Paraburkholderia sp. Ac-20340]
MPSDIEVRRLDANEAAASIPALADVLIDCVEGGASVSFMAPLARETALAFWQHVADGVAANERILLVAEDAQRRIVGTVQIVTAQPENQPHRADVAKMLVLQEVRKKGIGARLMHAVDTHAQQAGKTVLVLDTVTGGDAERLYARAGWQRAGTVPDYALMPDGQFCATTFYYKQLDPARRPPQALTV